MLVPFLALFVVREIPIVGAKMLYHHFFLLALSPGLVRLLLYCYTKVDNPTINLPTMGIGYVFFQYIYIYLFLYLYHSITRKNPDVGDGLSLTPF